MATAEEAAEVWDEWHASRRAQQNIHNDFEALARKCAQDHAKAHISHCPECYEKALERVKGRFLGETAEASLGREWFTGRKRFQKELAELLAEVQEGKVDPQAIQERIVAEKRAWYLETVAGAKARFGVGDGEGKGGLAAKLQDGQMPLPELVVEVRKLLHDRYCFSSAPAETPDVDAFLAQIGEAKDPAARLEVYNQFLFSGGDKTQPPNDKAAKGRQKYLDMVAAGKPLDQVILRVLADCKAQEASNKSRREVLEKRLETLHRGRNSHEQQKEKKARARAKAKERDSIVVAAPPLAGELYELPPCFTCEKEMDKTKDSVICLYCQLLSMWKVRGVTVYCNEECHYQGFPSHEKDHVCAAGTACINASTAGAPDKDGDGDIDMDGQNEIVFCAECVRTHKLSSMYCNSACMAKDFQRHREEVHIPNRRNSNPPINDTDMLEYQDPEKKVYVAKNLDPLLVKLSAAVREWEEKYRTSIGE